MPVRADDHYVLRKLADELLPWMVAGRLVRRRWFVRLALVHSYGSSIAALIGGFGIGTPLTAYLQGKSGDGGAALQTLRQTVPGWWFWAGVAALVTWAAVQIIVVKENVAARALFAKDCASGMQKFHADLWKALPVANPNPGIVKVQDDVMRKVQEAIEKGIWPWHPLPLQDRRFALELERDIDHIRRRFAVYWAAAPQEPTT